ncbi:hypothetical protein [Streptomyces sp. G45]|uniref:hypothetical protein n=1 Tax=Streptomyces sp. G45 TaxID=3406627 RepID=UPI003C268AC3
MLTSFRVLRALIVAETRAARTVPLLCGAACCAVAAVVPVLVSAHPDTEAAALLLRSCAVFAVTGVAFLLDDPAASSTAVTAVTRRTRRVVRLGAGALVPGVAWALAVGLIRVAMPEDRTLPWGGLAQEALVLALLTVLLTLIGLRFTAGRSGSRVAAPALVITLAIMVALPGEVALFVSPTDADWHDAVVRWRFLGTGTALGCLCLARDEPRYSMARSVAADVPEAGRPGRLSA